MTNERIQDISRTRLEAEYEASQWALAHALIKLGGRMDITQYDIDNAPTHHRVWYSRVMTDAGATVTHIELQEWKPNDSSQREA